MLYIFSYEYMSTKIHPCRYYKKFKQSISKILKFKNKKKIFSIIYILICLKIILANKIIHNFFI